MRAWIYNFAGRRPKPTLQPMAARDELQQLILRNGLHIRRQPGHPRNPVLSTTTRSSTARVTSELSSTAGLHTGRTSHALSGRVLPTPATTPAHPIDDDGSCKNSSFGVMSDSPVAVRAGASLLGRWLLLRVRQHSALSAVSWRSDLRAATNTQQLRRQNFCSRWTSLIELSHLWTVQTTAERTSFREAWTRRSVTSDMRRLRKTLTYLLIPPCSATWR